MLTWLIVAIEAISAVALIFLVLLHSGRGGGISDLMGGSVGAVAAGSAGAGITAPECKRLLYLVNPDDTRRDRFSEREGPARPLLGLSN